MCSSCTPNLWHAQCSLEKIKMKTTNHQPSELQGGNLFALQEALKKSKLPEVDFGLLLLIADMLDEIVAGKNRYMIVGATMNKSAFSVTVKGPDAPNPVYGADLDELNRLAYDLL